MSVLTNTKSNAARIPCGKCGGYVGGKLLLLPGEVLRTESRGENPKAAVTTNRKKSAEAIVPCFFQGKGRTIVSLKYRPEGGQCVEGRIPRKRGLPAKRYPCTPKVSCQDKRKAETSYKAQPWAQCPSCNAGSESVCPWLNRLLPGSRYEADADVLG